MIYSMTGFGKSLFDLNGTSISIEIKSLNSRYLDVNLRTPQLLREKENEIRRYISEKLERGKIDVSISMDSTNAADLPSIHDVLFKQYFEQLKQLSGNLSISDTDLFNSTLRVPHIWSQNKTELDEHLWFGIERNFIAAIDHVTAFRQQEGNKLKEDMLARLKEIELARTDIEQLAPARVQQVRDKLKQQLEELRLAETVDSNRYEQELIYYIEKMDINEELVRLQVHCKHFLQVLNDVQTQKGRKLNFIAQEMGREINTIGSKASDSNIQNRVIHMKDELEKIKEQLNNIL